MKEKKSTHIIDFTNQPSSKIKQYLVNLSQTKQIGKLTSLIDCNDLLIPSRSTYLATHFIGHIVLTNSN